MHVLFSTRFIVVVAIDYRVYRVVVSRSGEVCDVSSDAIDVVCRFIAPQETPLRESRASDGPVAV